MRQVVSRFEQSSGSPAYSVPAVFLVPSRAEAVTATDVTYLHADRLGSSVYVSDENGAAPTRVVYWPFGAEVEPVVGTQNAPRLGFTGQRLEEAIDLYDYGARWYDPALGGFLQPDAFASVFEPQGHNPYGYVRNDLVNLVDPTGNTFEDIIGTIQIGFSIGSVFSAGGVAVGNCGFFGLTGVNPFVSSCPPAPSIPQILSQVLDSIVPGDSGLEAAILSFCDQASCEQPDVVRTQNSGDQFTKAIIEIVLEALEGEARIPLSPGRGGPGILKGDRIIVEVLNTDQVVSARVDVQIDQSSAGVLPEDPTSLGRLGPGETAGTSLESQAEDLGTVIVRRRPAVGSVRVRVTIRSPDPLVLKPTGPSI